MHLQVSIIISIAVAFASSTSSEKGTQATEKQLAKRHLFEAFTGNPKFHSVFSNPDQTLATKFLGQETKAQLAPQTNPYVFYYAPPPLEEATPIEYDFFYDHTKGDDDDDDNDYYEDEYEESDSSEGENDGTNFGDPIYAINPSLIYYLENCTGVDNGSLTSDHGTENSTVSLIPEEHQQNHSDEFHINTIFNKTEGTGSTSYINDETSSETEETETEEITDNTTEITLIDNNNNYTESSNNYANNFSSQNDDIISHGIDEDNDNNKANASNLLLNNERDNIDDNKLTNKLPEDNLHNFNPMHADYFNQNSENSVLYTSSIYGNKNTEDDSKLHSHHHGIVHNPPPTKVDLTLERINNLLDRLQEKTYHLQKQVKHLSEEKKASPPHHNKHNSVHSNRGHLETNMNTNIDDFLKYNFAHTVHQHEKMPTENVPAISKWIRKAKHVLANVVINSMKHRRMHSNRTVKKLPESALPKYFPDTERNVVVIPHRENREMGSLPDLFPKDEAVVVPSNLQINDSPLGILRKDDVNTLREFFNNDFEKRHYRGRRIENWQAELGN